MGDSVKFTATARSLGIISAAVTVILVVAYAVTLTMGLLFLKSPQQPIGDPRFTILEVLIILMMPAMVALMVAVHAWAPMHAKTLSWIPPALGTAFAIRAGESLMPLAVLAFFGGITNIFLSTAMLVHGLSRNPPLWAFAYAAIGLAAVLSPLVVLRVRALRWAPLVAGVLLAIGALIFALGGYGAYLEHTSAAGGFGKWVPPAMRQGP
jgi:hypothetical protein